MAFMKQITKSIIPALLFIFLITSSMYGQSIPNDRVVATQDEVLYYTYMWEGERYPDGRPKVSDDLLERLKNIKIEDAWQLMNEMGYRNQFESGWKMLHDDVPIVGRALTTVYKPKRPDIEDRLIKEGLAAGHVGAQNSWPIDMLQENDVYIADHFGKIAQGILIGDKLGNSIFARTGTGVVFDGSIRDIETLAELDGFNAFVRDWHPANRAENMLMGINVPARIGNATVMPGDVILAKRMGVVFIPPHLVEEVVITSEIVGLRDRFVHERVRAGVYTPGQVDARWTNAIEEDFLDWLINNHLDKLPIPIEEMQNYLQHRTW